MTRPADAAETTIVVETAVAAEAAPPSQSIAIFQRLLRGGSAQLLAQLGQVGQEFLLPSLFLAAWGAADYGRWLATLAVVSYLSLLDLGGQNFIGNELALAHGRGDIASFRRTLSESLSFYVVISLVGLAGVTVIVGAAASVPNPGRLAGGGFGAGINIALVIPLAAAFLLAIPGGLFAKVYQSTGRFARGAAIGVGMRVVGITAFGVLLLRGAPPPLFAWFFLLHGALGTAVVILDTRRVAPAYRPGWLSLTAAKRNVRRLKGALAFWLIAVAQMASIQGIVLVLAVSTSPGTIAAYATHRLLAGVAGYVASTLSAPLWPELTFLWAAGELDRLRRVMGRCVKYVVFFGGAAALLLWLFAPAFYTLWTRHVLVLQPPLFAVLLVQSVVIGAYSACSWPLTATNHHQRVAFCYMGNAALSLVLAVLLVKPFGVAGVVAANLAGDVVFGLIPLPLFAARLLGAPTLSFYAAIAAALAALVPLMLNVFWISTRGATFGWQSLALSIPGAALSAMLALWLTGDIGHLPRLFTRCVRFAERHPAL